MLQTNARAPVTLPAPSAIPAWRFWVPVALQLLMVLTVPLPKVMASVTGVQVTLRTVPVDPVDFMRGRYVALRYEIGQPDTLKKMPGWKAEYGTKPTTLYWTLAFGKAGEPWQAVAIANERPARVPPGDVVLQGRSDGDISFGLEEYYVPENAGERLQAALTAHRTGNVANIKVDAWGHAVLTGFKVGNASF